MSRNGSGIYSLATGNPVVTGATISSTWANATLSDIATALTGSIAADGQTTITNNLPMSNYAHTGVADATVRTMYASAGQVQDSAFTFLTSPAGTNTMTAIASLGMSAYVTGQRFFFVAPTTNTGACTLNINSIGIKSITKQGTTALVSGDIALGAIVQVVYDGTEFQLVSPSAAPTVNSFNAGTTGLTPATATTGAITLAGTLAIANGGTGATTQANALTNVVGFTPVQQGGGTGQLTNKTYIGWNGTDLTAQVDSSGMGTLLAFGQGQGWTNVTSSRASGTTYTNSTGKPIFLMIYLQGTNCYITNFTVGAFTAPSFPVNNNGANSTIPLSFIIPSGSTYSITAVGSITWLELR